jgi:hypothetical protein
MFRTQFLIIVAIMPITCGCQNQPETPPADTQNSPAATNPAPKAQGNSVPAGSAKTASAGRAKSTFENVHAAAKSSPTFKSRYEMARKSGWNVAKAMIDEVLEKNAEEWPAAKAWLADFHKLTNIIAERTSAESLLKFVGDAKDVAEKVLEKSQKPCKVLIQFTCTPSGHTIKVGHQPQDVDEKPLKEYYKAAAKIEKLQVKKETVEFQIQITVAPKQEEVPAKTPKP